MKYNNLIIDFFLVLWYIYVEMQNMRRNYLWKENLIREILFNILREKK